MSIVCVKLIDSKLLDLRGIRKQIRNISRTTLKNIGISSAIG